MAKRVLLVDDEEYMTDMLGRVLTAHGYEVSIAHNGQQALRAMFAEKPELVLMDVAMPVMDGWQTCSRIREVSDVPVIMLTGSKTTEDDLARGIDLGADDYLTKPIGNTELIAKIRAVLRRAELPSSGAEKQAGYSDDHLTVDIPERKVIVDGERVKLTPTEFRLLALLVENTGHVMTHERLLREVWGWEYVDDIDYLRIYISHLRRKIEPNPRVPRYIVTEARVGYFFSGKGGPGQA